MRVRDAKQIARKWVREEGSAIAGFAGAFFHGSVNWQADDDLLPETSDLDVMMVLEDGAEASKPGKFVYEGVLLEASLLSASAVASPEQVLATYNLAGSFHVPSVILDPSGHLTRLQAAVAAEYAKRSWVDARSRHALLKAETGLSRQYPSAPFHEQVSSWLFPTGVMTHVLLVAGLKNPTVRKRYAAARNLLEEYGYPAYYVKLRSLLGCEEWTQAQAFRHIAALASAFDTASTIVRPTFAYAADISRLARPVAIDGSRDLVAAGRQREAVFWIVATFSRCMHVFEHDAPAEMQPEVSTHTEAYGRLLDDLGIASPADLRRRAEEALAMMPSLWSMAGEIMDANPEIEENRAGG
jgi:hypothetical protein